MKTKHILTLLLCLFMAGHAEAQLLKKLKKKAEQAAERAILKKTDEVVTKKTENAIDSITKKDEKKNRKKDKGNNKKEGSITDEEKAGGILDILLSQTPKDVGGGKENNDMSSMGEPIPAPPDNNVKLPEGYNFSYQATIQVKNNQGTVETEYLLQQDETYYAKKQINKDFKEYVVYDKERNMEVYFAEIEGKKIKARKKMDILTKAKMVGAYRDAPNRQVKGIGNKTLLGYACQGYEITTDAGTTQLWVTNDAPATLYSAMFEKRAEQPNSPFTKNSMIMEIVFTSKEDTTHDYQMLCTQLDANTLIFNNSDYQE